MHGYWMVDQFRLYKDLYNAVRWGLANPEDAWKYTGYVMAVKLRACLAVLSSLGIFFARKWNLSQRCSQSNIRTE
jgi:hypothetical protein